MRYISVTVSKKRTVSLGNDETAGIEISLSAEIEGDDVDKSVAVIEQRIDREIERFQKEAGAPTKKAPTKKAEKKAADPKPTEEPAPKKAEETDDMGLDDSGKDEPVTLDDVRASLRALNEKAGREHVKALLDEFSEDGDKAGTLPGVPEKQYKALFLKSEEALINFDQA